MQHIISRTYLQSKVWPHYTASLKNLHSSCILTAYDKQLLSKLRKSTGFPFSNCRKALEKFSNNYAEVNCETDFVARNAKFHSFVSTVANAFLHHASKKNLKRINASSDTLKSIVLPSGDKTLHDLTALEVGNLGENIAIRRGVFLKADDGEMLSSYVHITGPQAQKSDVGGGSSNCSTGKYAAIVLLRESRSLSGRTPLQELGRQISQHVVGMNPKTIGSMDDIQEIASTDERGKIDEDIHGDSLDSQRLTSDKYIENEKGETAGGKTDEDSDDDIEKREKDKEEHEEFRLVHQEYMFDTNITVGNLLLLNGIEVVDFVRLECGAVEDEVAINSEQKMAASLTS